MAVLYLDSSAIVKLAIVELESLALSRGLNGTDEVLSSAISQVEVPRALSRRMSLDAAIKATATAFERIGFIDVDQPVLQPAATLGPARLRSLDAIHLATALSIGPRLDAVVTYDRRMAEAATALGLAVLAPA